MLTHLIDPDRLREDDMIALPETPASCSICGRTGELLGRICNGCRELPPCLPCDWCGARMEILYQCGASEICADCSEKVLEFLK